MLTNEHLSIAERAACFHYSMAESIVQQCQLFAKHYGDFAVALCGGVFQNKLLTDYVMNRLQQQNFRPYLPQALPCNDGGLSYGQIIEAGHKLLTREPLNKS